MIAITKERFALKSAFMTWSMFLPFVVALVVVEARYFFDVFFVLLFSATGSSPVPFLCLYNLPIRRLGYALSRFRLLSLLPSKTVSQISPDILIFHPRPCLCPTMSYILSPHLHILRDTIPTTTS